MTHSSTGPPAIADHTDLPDPADTADHLSRHRPELCGPYRAALPGARTAVLARLWGALSREPLPGVAGRRHRNGGLEITLVGGRRLWGPGDAATPFAAPPAGLTVHLDGEAYRDPADLLVACQTLTAGPGDTTRRYAAELANSVANLALARAGGATSVPGGIARHPAPTEPSGGWESLVIDGHPLHPGCRTRTGMSTAEVLAYAPEHRPTVAVRLVEVPAGRWFTTGAGLPALLPVHPWQYDHVLSAYPWLRDTGARIPARPLMSLRTLSPTGEPDWQVKTAVDVGMTSAVRTVSAAAIRNGPTLTAFLAGLARRTGGLTVLPETAGGAVLVDGEPHRSLAVIRRHCPPPGTGEYVLAPAVLAATGADGRPLAARVAAAGYHGDPVGYLADLTRVLLTGPLALLRLGVALEAHGQNTLVVLRDGRPVGLRYRDVGGVRVSPARLRRHGLDPPPLYGDLCTDDPAELRDTLFAALAVVLGEQVAVLSRAYGLDPAGLWPTVRRVARDVAGDRAAGGDAAALFDDTLPVKATTAMRLAADPLAVAWARLANPLADPTGPGLAEVAG